MTADEQQALTTRAAAEGIGQWLAARGRLDQPISRLTMLELEAMAAAAISRFIVTLSEVRREAVSLGEALIPWPNAFGPAPSAPGRTEGSATSIETATISSPATDSARCAASTPARPSPPAATA